MKNIKSNLIYPIIIIIGILALYHTVIYNGFSGLDDLLMIEENWDNLTQLSHIKTAFTEDVFNGAQGSYYRPIQILSYMPDAFIANCKTPTPKIFFELNLFFFISAFLLLYFFLSEFNFSANFRLIFTLLIASHPTLTPAVAWIPGRVDIVLFLIVISSIWAFVLFVKTQKTKWALAHILLFSLGMFTKETSICIPTISLLFVHYYSDKNEAKWSWKKALDIIYWKSIILAQYKWVKQNKLILAGWIFTLVIWYILRKNALPDDPINFMGVLYQISVSWKEFLILAGSTILPINLQVFLEVSWPFVLFSIPGALLFILIPTLLKTSFKNYFFGFLWMFLFIFPTTISDYLNYHRMFIPLVGMAFILKPLDQKYLKKQWLIIITTSLGLLFIWQNITFQKAFHNRVNFWNNAVNYSPNSAFANNGMAWSFHLDNKNDSALIYYERVVNIRPDRENVRVGMALIHEENKNFKQADSLLQEEFKATKDSALLYFYIGQVLLNRGDTQNAVTNLTLGLPSCKSSRNSRLYYDSLDIKVSGLLHHPVQN